MKKCNKCGFEYIEELFPFKNKQKGIRQSTCKYCHKIYVDNHYQLNKQAYKDKAKRNDKIYKNNFIEYKKSLNCLDCGISFKDAHWICDFHHLDESKKESNISQMFKTANRKLMNEIKKCVPLCANCHRTRHYKKFMEV